MGEATESFSMPLLVRHVSRWRWWLSRASLAMLDQGLISGSNFLLTVLLARWLAPEQYGAYALAFSIFMLLANPYESLVSDPMMVFGPSSHADHGREYLGAVLKIAAVLSSAFAAGLALSALAVHCLAPRSGFASALAGLSFLVPSVLIFWTARFAFYLRQSPGSAALGALLYSALALSSTFLVFHHGLLSPFTGFCVMAVAAVATAVFMLVRLKPLMNRQCKPTLSEVWNQHWRYGRWILGTATVRWIPGNVMYALTGSLLGMREVGELRALLNLTMPILTATTSLSNLFLPHMSGEYGKGRRTAARASGKWVTLLYFGLGVSYLILLTVLRGEVLRLLYGGKFTECKFLAPWVVLGAVLIVTSFGPTLGLRAIQSPSSVFAAYTTSSVVAITFGVLATWLFGLRGAVASYVLTGLTLFTASAYIFRRKTTAPAATSEARGTRTLGNDGRTLENWSKV